MKQKQLRSKRLFSESGNSIKTFRTTSTCIENEFWREKLSNIYSMIRIKQKKWSDLTSSWNKVKGKSKKAAIFVRVLNNM